MTFQQLAEEVLRNQASDEQIKTHFSYRDKRTFKDVDKYRSKTIKDLGVNVNAATIGYLSSYLSMILRQKTAS